MLITTQKKGYGALLVEINGTNYYSIIVLNICVLINLFYSLQYIVMSTKL